MCRFFGLSEWLSSLIGQDEHESNINLLPRDSSEVASMDRNFDKTADNDFQITAHKLLTDVDASSGEFPLKSTETLPIPLEIAESSSKEEPIPVCAEDPSTNYKTTLVPTNLDQLPQKMILRDNVMENPQNAITDKSTIVQSQVVESKEEPDLETIASENDVAVRNSRWENFDAMKSHEKNLKEPTLESESAINLFDNPYKHISEIHQPLYPSADLQLRDQLSPYTQATTRNPKELMDSECIIPTIVEDGRDDLNIKSKCSPIISDLYSESEGLLKDGSFKTKDSDMKGVKEGRKHSSFFRKKTDKPGITEVKDSAETLSTKRLSTKATAFSSSPLIPEAKFIDSDIPKAESSTKEGKNNENKITETQNETPLKLNRNLSMVESIKNKIGASINPHAMKGPVKMSDLSKKKLAKEATSTQSKRPFSCYTYNTAGAPESTSPSDLESGREPYSTALNQMNTSAKSSLGQLSDNNLSQSSAYFNNDSTLEKDDNKVNRKISNIVTRSRSKGAKRRPPSYAFLKAQQDSSHLTYDN